MCCDILIVLDKIPALPWITSTECVLLQNCKEHLPVLPTCCIFCLSPSLSILCQGAPAVAWTCWANRSQFRFPPTWDAPPPGNYTFLSFASSRTLFRCHFTGKAFHDDLDIPVSSFCLLTLLYLPSLSNSSLVDLLVYYWLSVPPS